VPDFTGSKMKLASVAPSAPFEKERLETGRGEAPFPASPSSNERHTLSLQVFEGFREGREGSKGDGRRRRTGDGQSPAAFKFNGF